MLMKRIFILIAVFGMSLAVCAEDSIAVQTDTLAGQTDTVAVPAVARRVMPNVLDSMPGVQVIQDSTVAQLLQACIQGGEEWVEIAGYRVQIYSSNQQQKAKTEALRLEEKLKDQLGQTVYVQYAPPFWKVRIGDFRTYEEAREYKKEVVRLFPALLGDTYIVRDQIKVLK